MYELFWEEKGTAQYRRAATSDGIPDENGLYVRYRNVWYRCGGSAYSWESISFQDVPDLFKTAALLVE